MIVVLVANSDVISSVSETLRARLHARLLPMGATAELHDLSSLPSSAPPRATVFLYDVVEEPTMRNRPKHSELVGGTLRIRKQPLGLCLHYMVTPWGGTRATEQEILGRALQAMYDDAIIDGADLQGVLAATPTELRVSLAPMQLEDRARVWWATGLPYRLSVNYEVRVVDIDPETSTESDPVLSRRLRTGVTT